MAGVGRRDHTREKKKKNLQVIVYRTEASKHYLTELMDAEDRTEKVPELTPLHPGQNEVIKARCQNRQSMWWLNYH